MSTWGGTGHSTIVRNVKNLELGDIFFQFADFVNFDISTIQILNKFLYKN